MKSACPSLGRRLESVAVRYRHPCAAGVGGDGRRGGKTGLRWASADRKYYGRTPCEPADSRVTRLEALLFLSRQPQTSRKLAQLAGLADGTKARTLVQTLNRRYDALGSAFRVEEVAGGYQLMTRAKFAPWLRRLYAAPMEVRLSPAGHGNPGGGGLSPAGAQGGDRSHPRSAIGRGPSPTDRARLGADRRAVRRARPAVPLRNHQTVPSSFRFATSR